MPDAVLDPCLGAVAGLQGRQLPGAGVGDEGLVAPPVGLLEQGQLSAGVRTFPSHDHPHPRGPVAQVEQPGQLGDVPAGADASVRVDRAHPGRGGDQGDGVADLLGEREPDGVLHPAATDLPLGGESVQQVVRGTGAVGADQQVLAVDGGDLGDRRSQDLDVVRGGV